MAARETASSSQRTRRMVVVVCIGCLVVQVGALLMAYVFQTSPAWLLEYGYALRTPPQCPSIPGHELNGSGSSLDEAPG